MLGLRRNQHRGDARGIAVEDKAYRFDDRRLAGPTGSDDTVQPGVEGHRAVQQVPRACSKLLDVPRHGYVLPLGDERRPRLYPGSRTALVRPDDSGTSRFSGWCIDDVQRDWDALPSRSPTSLASLRRGRKWMKAKTPLTLSARASRPSIAITRSPERRPAVPAIDWGSTERTRERISVVQGEAERGVGLSRARHEGNGCVAVCAALQVEGCDAVRDVGRSPASHGARACWRWIDRECPARIGPSFAR